MNSGNSKNLTIVLTICYVAVMVWIIMMKMESFSDLYMQPHFRDANLVPFHYNQENDFHFIEVIGNVAIFIPFGVYLKMLCCSGRKTILCAAGLSLIFEVTQFVFGIGATDITDLMMNTLGAAAGVQLYNLICLAFKGSGTLKETLNRIAVICTIILLVKIMCYKAWVLLQ